MWRPKRIFRRGNVLIESAFALPVLFLVVMGMIEFGQFFYIRNAFQAAARDVARASILATAQQADPASKATATLGQANVTFNTSWMTIVDYSNGNSAVADVSAVPPGHTLIVTIEAQYGQIPNAYLPLSSMTGQGIAASRMCEGQCTMIKE
jgi:Flp pilus assembly protein TadG